MFELKSLYTAFLIKAAYFRARSVFKLQSSKYFLEFKVSTNISQNHWPRNVHKLMVEIAKLYLNAVMHLIKSLLNSSVGNVLLTVKDSLSLHINFLHYLLLNMKVFLLCIVLNNDHKIKCSSYLLISIVICNSLKPFWKNNRLFRATLARKELIILQQE